MWRGFNRDEYTDEEWELVNSGALCPNSECKGINIKCVGINHDGIFMNAAYNCLDCKQKWEGD